MGKRGPKPRDPAVLKSQPVSIRLTPALKSRLEQEAKAERRTLSQEIESRLRMSFELEMGPQKEFGLQNWQLVVLIAEQLKAIEEETERSLFAHRSTFDECKTGINSLLDYWMPSAGNADDDKYHGLGEAVALLTIKKIELAEAYEHFPKHLQYIPRLLFPTTPIDPMLSRQRLPKPTRSSWRQSSKESK
jgi:hypothetical protein